MIKSSKMELDNSIKTRVKGVIPVSTLAPFTKITVKNKKIGLLTPTTDTKSINNQLLLFLLVIVYKSYCYKVLEV